MKLILRQVKALAEICLNLMVLSHLGPKTNFLLRMNCKRELFTTEGRNLTARRGWRAGRLADWPASGFGGWLAGKLENANRCAF